MDSILFSCTHVVDNLGGEPRIYASESRPTGARLWDAETKVQ